VRTFRLALAQLNPTVGDLAGNAAKVVSTLDACRDLAVDLVVFPELMITGYPPEDLLLKPRFISDNRAALVSVLPATRGLAAVVGFVDAANGDIYNAAALIADGRLVDIYHKQYLPNYGVFDEDRYFRAGTRTPVYVLGGVTIGLGICEDIWYAAGPATTQALAGAEVILNINASPYHAGKRLFRERMLATRASDNGAIVGYVNMVGGQDELVFDGGSVVFDPEGTVIARARQFVEDLLIVDLDVEGVFRRRLHDPRWRKLAHQTEGRVERIVLSTEPVQRARPPVERRIETPLEPVAEIYQALVTGTRDYVHKNGFQKVVVGLSGGIDSSLTAVIAADALGPENVVGVSMPSRFSSPGSLEDARTLAENLGIELLVIPIEPAFQAMLQMLAGPFEGTPFGLAEENLQARIRGNILMALANKFGYLVLTTGNKSEMATGYATLYGDMAGGFAVLKDVLKTTVYALARYRNACGPRPVIPESVLTKEPSAELRPNQRDTDSLPPYPVLDPILKAYVEEDRSFEEIVGLGFDPETVRRVILMVDRSEYKRRQAPPGVKITPRAFGKDRRLPIANRYRMV
jgi:NAD+ synthase (glutamine-hydrolysing)